MRKLFKAQIDLYYSMPTRSKEIRAYEDKVYQGFEDFRCQSRIA